MKTGLAQKTIEAVRQRFEGYKDHAPADEYYSELEQIATVIQGMADAKSSLESKYYVSTLPPGIGKTTTVEEAMRLIVSDPASGGVGVILFIERVAEIAKIVDSLGLPKEAFSTN